MSWAVFPFLSQKANTFYHSSRIRPISPCFFPTTKEISKKKKMMQSMKYLFHVCPAGPIFYKCDVCFPPSCRAMVPSQTVINAELGWRANAAATLVMLSPLLPPSRCPSPCCHGSPCRCTPPPPSPKKNSLAPLLPPLRRRPVVRSECLSVGRGLRETAGCNPFRRSVCTVQGLWIICSKASPSGNINNGRGICLPG